MPVSVPADQVQIIALTTALKANVRVAYLDGHAHPNPDKSAAADPDTSYVNVHQFDNGAGEQLEPVALLYRCGLHALWTADGV